MEGIIKRAVKESLSVKEGFFSSTKNINLILRSVDLIVDTFKQDGRLLIAGNGGSAADAQHLAGEFVNRFELTRPPLPAIALTTDTSVLTSIGNDFSFDEVFSKQVRALGRQGDILLAISTSGSSTNVVRAVEVAGSMGIKTIALTGRDGGRLAQKVDILLNVDSTSTPRIQEVHTMVCHILCELVERKLFGEEVSR